MKLTRILLVLAIALAGAACGKQSSTGAGSSESPGAAADVAAYCTLQSQLDERFQTEFDPQDPDGLRKLFEFVVDALGRIADLVPADLSAKVTEGRNLFIEAKADLEAVDYDFTALSPEAVQRFSEVATAFQELGQEGFAEFTAEHCGADVESSP